MAAQPGGMPSGVRGGSQWWWVCRGASAGLPRGLSSQRPAALRGPYPDSSSAANTMFETEWRGRRVALKASNGRYVCMKKNGQLAATSDFVGERAPLTWPGIEAGPRAY